MDTMPLKPHTASGQSRKIKVAMVSGTPGKSPKSNGSKKTIFMYSILTSLQELNVKNRFNYHICNSPIGLEKKFKKKSIKDGMK